MEYIISESKIHDVLNELIEKRFKGMVFRKASYGSVLGFLPENIGDDDFAEDFTLVYDCLLYTSPSPRDRQKSRMPSSA